MKQIFINDNGRKHTVAQLIDDAFVQEGISLSTGSAYNENIIVNGYHYTDGHVDSFGQVFDAVAISLKEGEYATWNTLVDDYPPTYINPEAPNGAVLVMEYAMGNGAAYPQPNGYFELLIDGAPCISFNMKKHNCLFEGKNGARLYLEIKRSRFAKAAGDQFSLDSFVENESAYVNGLAYLYLPHDIVGDKTSLTISIAARPQQGEVSRRWLRIGFGYYWLSGMLEAGINSVLHGVKRPTLDGQNIYFGDIHVHTAQSGVLDNDGCGIGSVTSNLTYARDVACLDFCGIADHDWQLDAKDWKLLRDTNDTFNASDRFVTMQAYEWTSSTYGHRNVYFRNGSEIPAALKPFDSQAEPFTYVKYGTNSPNDPDPSDLWQWLESNHLQAMTFPHHPSSEQFVMDLFKFYNEKYDRCVEVYSSWGCMFSTNHPVNICSERIEGYDITRYADRLHLGFVASSDGHDGNAGDSNVSKYKRHIGHYAGSGHVAVICDTLTREDIYDAMYARHCYAVTGEPILLSVALGESIMGDAITAYAEKLPLRVCVQGTQPIVSATLYKNGAEALSLPLSGNNQLAFEQDIALQEHASYWVEICQADGEYAWSSPIFYAPAQTK